MRDKNGYSTGKLIREARLRKYKTVKEFLAQHAETIDVSYPHYATIEQGKNLPEIKLAVAIADILEIDLRLICHMWARDQMPTAETEAFFEPTPGLEVQGIPTTFRQALDDFYVLNETHIPFLLAHPAAWGVISVILAFSGTTPPTEKDIEVLFKLPSDEVQAIVEWGRNQTLIISEKGVLKSRRKFFHLPNTPEFKQVRDNNFLALANELISNLQPDDLLNKEANRITFMRRITRTQASEIVRKIEELVGHLGNLEDKGQEFYSLAIAFGPRFKFTGSAKVGA